MKFAVLLASGLGLLLLLTSGRYGYHGDELYFWAAGQHLDWSYADQPPLLPLLVRAMDTLFPGSLVALRLPALAFAVGSVLVAASVARELGGSRRAQVLTAAAVVGSPVLATGGHVLTTTVVDSFLWIVITWLLVRWLRVRSGSLLLWLGLTTAVALQVKYLVVFFWLAVGLAVVLFGPREPLRSKHFWLGAGIAVLSSVPALIWQASNGWPQLGMRAVLAGQEDPGFFVLLLASAGILGVPLLGYGLWCALRSQEHRFLGAAFLILGVVVFFAFGHGYYLAGMFTALWAIGAVALDEYRWVRWAAWPAAVLSVAMVVVLLPVQPVQSLADKAGTANTVNAESVGWPQLADTVAAAYRAAPAGTSIVAHTYWPASALAFHGPSRGLPEVYSPHRGYWYFGTPPESAATLYVGGSQAELMRHFDRVRQVATVDNGLGVRNSSQGMPVWLCEGRRSPWSALWPSLRSL
ncbi:ArnT family glycosyltransferase [Allokutzneria albata]|uniref:4-amino-4-deoxy-L-arabinose transferase n=1 Tax=Allokutzneria albata TaxID=211114 RepID=A0A1G9SP67_ALLAB|nr:glycosyltransferase family 39 protein [Allokutzneria albata]SDM37174.1 4-amino-4-deoxy-L-arabinose transferase [Allokutzneria albata]